MPIRKSRSTRAKSGALDQDARISALEHAVEQLKSELRYGAPVPAAETVRAMEFVVEAATDRYVRDTEDGWLQVMSNGAKLSLPSGLKVSFKSTSAGRDHAVVLEGVNVGITFDVATNNLATTSKRYSDLKITVKRKTTPVDIGGVAYELDVNLAYKDGVSARTAGPFSAMTHPTNPIPAGTFTIGIADYPHLLGSGYKPHGTVWFHIHNQRDRYVHTGSMTEGCLTCAPRDWEQIYAICNYARGADTVGIGTLTVQ